MIWRNSATGISDAGSGTDLANSGNGITLRLQTIPWARMEGNPGLPISIRDHGGKGVELLDQSF